MSMRVYEIFKQIEATAGKNDKIEIIKQNADNVEFVEYLKFLYDEMITTGLSTKKINKETKIREIGDESYFGNPLGVMKYLMENNTGTDKDIVFVQRYLGSFVMLDSLAETVRMGNYIDWLKQVFTKSYKCGITASSVNKAIPDLIPEFKVMLANSYDKFSDRVKDTFYLSLKLDGHRTLAFIIFEDGKVSDIKFRTRKGHEITGLSEIKNEMINSLNAIKFAKTENIVLDGEITVLDDSTNPESVFQSTSKIIRKDGEKTGLKFHVFDCLKESDFWLGKSRLIYTERRGSIEAMFKNCFVNTKYIVKVPILYSGSDVTEIAKWSDKVTKLGHEGIMLNTSGGFYRTKRTPDLLKVKKFHSADIECLGAFRGDGKYSKTLGGIYVNYKNSKVGVGSGFTDEQRDYYWNNQDEIVGKIVEIKYFEESTNQKDDSISLRFPVFVSVRSDKTVKDVNYD